MEVRCWEKVLIKRDGIVKIHYFVAYKRLTKAEKEYISEFVDKYNKTNPIKSYRDLIVYQSSYSSCLDVIFKILPNLPKEEKYDLVDQLRRSTKAIPRLIAEGYAKRHQKAGFQKYLYDAMGECNESLVGFEQCRDLYGGFIDKNLINSLIDKYIIIGKQLYKLSIAWKRFKTPTS